MARSIWKGSISFGLVNIPVGLYSAETRDEIHFNLLDRRNMAPIHYKRVNEKSGEEVAWEDTARGYQFEHGRYVVLSDGDLTRANPEATQTVEITDFVDLAEISPLYFDKPYYLAPAKNGAKSYALLRETLRRTGKAGIAKVVIRTKQYLAAVVPEGDVIVLDLLRYAHELRDPAELDLPRGKQGVSEKELEMAGRLVEGMVTAWNPERYRDDYQADVMAMIDERVKSGQLESAPETPAPRRAEHGAKVVDLMSLLKRSVEEGGRAGRQAPAGRARTRARGAAAAAAAAAAMAPGGAAGTSRRPARRPARAAGKRRATSRRQSA